MSNAIRVHHGHFGRVAVLDVSRSLVMHAHGQAHVLLKIGGADGCFAVRDEAVPITDTAAVLINSREPHAYHHSASREPLLVLALYLHPSWLTTSGAVRSGPRFATPSRPVCETLLDKARRLAGALMFSGVNAGEIDRAVLDILAGMPWCDTAASDAAPVDRRIARCVAYMREHLEEREDLSAIGSRFGLSRPHLFYLFQRVYAVTPHVYWNTLRMEYAVEALCRNDSSIGAISCDLGFSSQSNFTRFFQGIQGVGPREYRSAARTITAPARAA